MARLNIDTGILGNPSTGDTLRTAMTKINTNFAEVYSLVQDGSSGLIATDITNGDLKLQANGTGVIEIDQLQISGDSITSIITNGSVDLTGNGTGGVNIEALHFNGTSINSADSSSINLNENVDIDGDLNVTGNITGTFSVNSIGDVTAVGSTLSTPSNADFDLTPGGTGNVNLNGDTVRVGDNNADATITTQGTGDLTLSTNSGTNSGTIKIADGANGDITLDTDGTGDVLLKGDKVGIGTVNQPDTLLHLKDTNAVITLQRTADANTPGLSFQNSNGNVRGVIKLDGTSGTSNEIFMQTYDGSSQAERFRVTHTGAKVSGTLNVDDGISITDNTITTSATNANLELTAAGTGEVTTDTNFALVSGTPFLKIQRTDNANVPGIDFQGQAGTSGAKILFDGTGGTANELIFQTFTVAGGIAEAFRVQGGGAKVTGTLDIDGGVSITDNTITSSASNADLEINASGTGTVVLENMKVGTGATVTTILDEDNMASNSATALATQQSIKAYVDAEISGVSTDTTGDLTITGSTISAPSNADLTLNAGGTGSVDIEGIQIKGTEISSTDSTQVTIKENLHVTGNITGTINANQLSGTLPAISGELLTGVAKHAFKTVQIGGGNSLVADDPVDTLTIHPGNNVTITDDQALDSFTINVNGMGDLTFVGSTIISPSNADITLSPGGTGSVAMPGVTITDNTITSNRSNDNLELNASGTGTVVLENLKVGTGATVTTILDEDNMSTNSATALATQQSIKAYVDSEISGVSGGSTGDLTISGSTISAPSNADLTLNAGGTGSVDIDGIQIKGTSISSTDSTQININENVNIDGTLTVSGSPLSGTLNTVGNTGSGSVALASETLQVTGTTNEINVAAAAFALSLSLADDISGIVSLTASSFLANDAIKIIDNKITGTRTNENVELEANGTGSVIAQSPFVAQSPVTFNAGYIEKINTLTSSSTITVDCSAASIHKVTLATNTEFNIANLPTGGSVTLIITQDGSGNNTATFGTDGSSAVKFPSNSSTLSTGAGDIDVVTIVNDGTNFLGNIAKDYRSS